ncbi:MAG: ABC transporter substrate-binding protein [Treponema sp.]|nr:ABC transporter substrate-binding protein [Treponema sp.]
MRKGKFIVIAILLMAVLVVNVHAGGGRQATTEGKNTLVIANTAQPVSLDPTLGNDGGSNIVYRRLYDTLVTNQYINNQLTITPGLAESWDILAPDSYRFNIRRGVRFHNGDELKASDVKFSLDRAIASARVGFIVNMIREVVVVNDYQVILNLHFPFAPLLSNLSHVGASIVSERAVREYGEQFGLARPVGTGPFIFDEWVQGVSVSFNRNDNYWGHRPAYEHMLIRVIPDATMRLIEVETGNVDIALAINPSDVAMAAANRNINMMRELSMEHTYIAFNNTRPPYTDPNVRRAIAHALNRDVMRTNIFQGTGQLSNGPINDAVWGSINRQLQPYEFNLARARELMATAGHANGFDTTITINAASSTALDTAEYLQSQLRQLNINVRVEAYEAGILFERLAAGEHDMFTLSWTTVTGDADYGMFPLFHTQNWGTAGNRFRYSNPRVDTLLEQGRYETNPTRRLEYYTEVQRIIRDEAPWVFVLQNEFLMATKPNIRGFVINPLSTAEATFERITFE